MANEPQIIIIVDTREPEGAGWEPFFTVPTVRMKLDVGDYSISGANHLLTIERKSVPDLLSSLTHERQRFERELHRGKGLDFFAVIIEGSASDFRAGRFGPHAKGANPKAMWESVCAFSVRYCPFFFASDRRTAALMCESLLLKWVREHRCIIEAVEKGRTQTLNSPRCEDRGCSTKKGGIE